MLDKQATERTRRRYQRISSFYDGMEVFSEKRYQNWRSLLWEKVEGPAVLEVGVGTGKNLLSYPEGMTITAVDLTPGMLDKAKKKAAELNIDVDLQLGDIQTLDYPDDSFDDIVATFVFCSVPDPVMGLSNIRRMVKPDGRVLLLEHMRASNKAVGLVMDVLNPLVVRLMGANINRRTIENVAASGLTIESIQDLGWGGIFKLIIAHK